MKVIRIGITGANEFLGKHIERALKEKRSGVVFGLSKLNTLNPNKLKKFVRDKDVVVHVAAIHRGTEIQLVKGNVAPAYNIVSAIRKSKKRPKIIFISSVQAKTDSVYGQTKRLAEIMLEEYSRNEQAPVTIFRVTNEFGEWAKPFYNSVIATFCCQLTKGLEISVNSSPKKINFIYAGDIAKAVVGEVSKKRKKLFNLMTTTSKNNESVSKIANILKSFSKNNKRPILKNKFYNDLYNTYLSYAKSKRK
jgi:UDP-2-acetamido-2,6-beta-L-arabino-hexul-4-ose reductase